jgi:hypothetical protein
MAEAKDGVTKISCVLALLLFASAAIAQNTQVNVAGTAGTAAPVAAPQATAQTTPAASTSAAAPASPINVSYVGGQLGIDASGATLSDVLTKVAALLRVKIEIPDGASGEVLPIVKLKPGPARQILASLLYGLNFDYLITSSDADPQGIQNVVLIPHQKMGSGGNGAEMAARPSSGSHTRGAGLPSESEETPEPSNPIPAQPDNAVAQASSPAAAAPPPEPPAAQSPQQPMLSPAAALINRSGLTTEGAMSPPAALDQQSISQQLLQMYQQRTQMTQQQRQTIQPTANPGNQ